LVISLGTVFGVEYRVYDESGHVVDEFTIEK